MFYYAFMPYINAPLILLWHYANCRKLHKTYNKTLFKQKILVYSVFWEQIKWDKFANLPSQ